MIKNKSTIYTGLEKNVTVGIISNFYTNRGPAMSVLLGSKTHISLDVMIKELPLFIHSLAAHFTTSVHISVISLF